MAERAEAIITIVTTSFKKELIMSKDSAVIMIIFVTPK